MILQAGAGFKLLGAMTQLPDRHKWCQKGKTELHKDNRRLFASAVGPGRCFWEEWRAIKKTRAISAPEKKGRNGQKKEKKKKKKKKENKKKKKKNKKKKKK